MPEYWIVCGKNHSYGRDVLLAGPWQRKRHARRRLREMLTDTNVLLTSRPVRFIVKTVR